MTKILLTSFVLTGIVDSKDDMFATVEINLNPALATPSTAVVPISAFPCEIKEGSKFYILKLTEDTYPVIICGVVEDNVGE